MRIELRLFAIAKEHAQSPSIELDLPENPTVADLKQALALAVPSLTPLISKIRFAIDSEYATDDASIPAGAHLAAIPPVSGGSPTT